MRSPNAPPVSLSGPQRLVAAAAAAAVAAALSAALLLGFGLSGPDVWLTPDAELLAQSATCDRQAGRQQRLRCKQQLVAARLNGVQSVHQLAER